MYYYVHLICKASVYKLFSELFSSTSCLLYADTVPLIEGSYYSKLSDCFVVYISMHVFLEFNFNLILIHFFVVP